MKNTLILFLFSSSLMAFAQQSHKFFDSLANELVSNTTIPSVVFSYITPDTCLYGVAGVNNLNDKKEIQLTDKFSLGSNTKAITALIAMKMVEKGQISMDTKLLDLIPSLKKEIKKTYRKITLGELLSHRAHVRAYMAGEDYEDFPEELPENLIEQREIFVKHVLNQDPVVSELSFNYSNAGYVIASHMMEIAADKSYEELVDDFMKEMGNDYYFGLANREDATAPSGYWMEGEIWTEIGPDHEYSGVPELMNAAGMLSMNIVDYSKLIQMQLKGLNGADTYISAESMHTHHFGIENYAYGWINAVQNGLKFSTHDGSLSTNHCHTLIIPKLSCAITIMFNSDLPEHVQAMKKLEQDVLKEMLR
mgnify:FL=1